MALEAKCRNGISREGLWAGQHYWAHAALAVTSLESTSITAKPEW
jgi:hypothetical protein